MEEDIGLELRKTLCERISNLRVMKPDDPGYAAEVECINKLTRLIIDHDSELEDFEFRKDSAKSERKHKIIGHAINGAGIVLPLWLYHWWMKKGFEFEKTGAFTSFTFKNLIGKFKPIKN